MFRFSSLRFSADQRHALRHGVEDLGKLTLAVLFLSSALGLMPFKALHPEADAALGKNAHKAKPSGTGLRRLTNPLRARL